MKVKINFNDKTYNYLNNPTKRKLSGLISRLASKKTFSGTCIVEYKRSFFNEFDFVSYEDFIEKIDPCLDTQLIKDFS